MTAICLSLLLLLHIQLITSELCAIKNYGQDKNVCVCNSTYCDTVPPIAVKSGTYQIYSTSQQNPGIISEVNTLRRKLAIPSNYIRVDRSKRYQSIIGFGGAFTDAAGINIKSLPDEVQEKIIQSYWSKTGIEYSVGRVPVGGTDFSTRGYSYDDDCEADVHLEHFALQNDDYEYKIPFIQKAIDAKRGNEFKLFASAWSAPLWMKTNGTWSGRSFLKEEYYQTWANYYVKFFEAYKENQIDFWGMTTQNEPFDGFISSELSRINALGFGIFAMNKWLQENLGPTIRNSSFSNLKIIVHDDNRLTLPLLPLMLNDDKTLSYIDGIGLHWYLDKLIPPSWIDFVKTDRKDLFLLSTEACSGFLHKYGDLSVDLGNWTRAQNYINDIFENLEHGVGGWVDWNIVLNEEGGPTYIDNKVDSPIIANATAGEFYKQPMFYALGHFSKFVIPDSIRISTQLSENAQLKGLKSLAFLRPDNLIVVIIHNTNNNERQLDLEVINKTVVTLTVEANSINTVIFK